MLMAATTQLQLAISNMQDAQNKSMKAEFKVGRVRHLIQRSGFGSVLCKCQSRQPQVQTFNGMHFLSSV